VSLLSKKTLTKKLLQSKKFREAYVFEHIKRHIPFQVRTMRTEREWSQAQAGEAIGKPQNVISRLESPAYGKLTLQTLLDIANGFDVGLLIKFVPLSRLVKEYEDVSFEALSAKSVSDEREVQRLNEWAEERVEPVTANAIETSEASIAPVNAFQLLHGAGQSTPIQPKLRVMYLTDIQAQPTPENYPMAGSRREQAAQGRTIQLGQGRFKNPHREGDHTNATNIGVVGENIRIPAFGRP